MILQTEHKKKVIKVKNGDTTNYAVPVV